MIWKSWGKNTRIKEMNPLNIAMATDDPVTNGELKNAQQFWHREGAFESSLGFDLRSLALICHLCCSKLPLHYLHL